MLYLEVVISYRPFCGLQLTVLPTKWHLYYIISRLKTVNRQWIHKDTLATSFSLKHANRILSRYFLWTHDKFVCHQMACFLLKLTEYLSLEATLFWPRLGAEDAEVLRAPKGEVLQVLLNNSSKRFVGIFCLSKTGLSSGRKLQILIAMLPCNLSPLMQCLPPFSLIPPVSLSQMKSNSTVLDYLWFWFPIISKDLFPLCEREDGLSYYKPLVKCISGTTSKHWTPIQNRSSASLDFQIHGM